MTGYIRRRLFQSLLIVLGVMLITFILFRAAAGDPALVRLGKNAVASELEAARAELGTDKPLLFGYECKTEAFPSIDFTKGLPVIAGVLISDSAVITEEGLMLGEDQRIEFDPQFAVTEADNIMFVCEYFDGEILKANACKGGKGLAIEGPSTIKRITFHRLQTNPFNSQLFDTFGELLSFSSTFPYVSFFNFGESLTTREPVRDILARCIGPSLALMIPVFLGELLLGIILGLAATRFKDRWPDRLIMLVSVMGMSVSYLAFILFGQYFLAYRLSWFPVWGFESAAYLALPILIGIVSGLGGGVRFYRTVFVNELNKEYLRTARAKGASEWQIYVRHLLPNAFIPIISRISILIPFLFTGSLLLEKFFGIPGLGFAGINALANADLQLLKAVVLLSTLLFVAVNLVTDILYAVVDPRIRLT